MDYPTKKSLIVPGHPDLSCARRLQLVGLSRSGYYYQPKINQEDLGLTGLIDRIYTDCPFYGSRRLRAELRRRFQIFVNRKRIQRLMRLMGIEAVYPKPKRGLSNPDSKHRKYPYLLHNLAITRPNQVWSTDITYIKLANGFAYLVAVMDWFSRFVPAWVLSPTMEVDFCLDNLQRALTVNVPAIHNSDQGSQFTSPQYTGLLTAQGIQISMDGRGRYLDNIFTERLWRTVKYENVYLHSYADLPEAEAGLADYFDFYNHRRLHQALNYRTPAEVYFQK